MRELLSLYFEGKGLEVSAVGTVAEAEAIIELGEFDLLILDWRLEGTDGLGLLNLSKKLHPKTPVLIFTGASDDLELFKKVFAGRADAVVRKLGSFDLLACEVFACLGRSNPG